ncbi:MAG TPA: hypothetical protein VFK57_16880 [Vicinamibacterales bacterium]|nr:hypothetical protein [Vicinamibacterales bacterium]
MHIGIPELILLSVAFVAVAGTIAGAVVLIRAFAGKAKRFGYPTTRAYLRAVPRTDAEKQDATDLALKGGVFCILGVLFPPFILIGLVPLFFGARKIVWTSMGLGLVDDADQREA